MASFEDFLAALAQPYIWRPFVTSIVIAVACAVVSTYVMLRKMVFLVDGIAHSSFAGGALAILLGVNPLLTITVFGVGSALSMAFINERGKLSNDTAVGIIFAFTMALGIVFISMIRTYTIAVNALLFGNIVLVDWVDFWLTLAIAGAVLAAIRVLKNALFFMTFDEELARANGLPVRVLSYVFIIMVAAVIVVSLKVIGVILLLALIVTPAATAYQLTYKIDRMMVYAVVISASCAAVGFILHYMLEISASAMIVVCLTATFVVAMIASPKRRYKRAQLDEGTCVVCTRAVSSTTACAFCDHATNGQPTRPAASHRHDHDHDHGHDHDHDHGHDHGHRHGHGGAPPA